VLAGRSGWVGASPRRYVGTRCPDSDVLQGDFDLDVKAKFIDLTIRIVITIASVQLIVILTAEYWKV